MAVQKIDLNEIAKQLIKEVKLIEAKDIPQGQKTTAHKRAAQKALNALYLDKRKYGGKKANNRISLNTLPTYLTRLRKALEELNLRHHLLEREAERMQKRHPLHAALFTPFLNKELSLADLRKAKLDAKAALQAERELADRLLGIDFGKTYKSALIMLGKEFPSWKERLLALVDEKGRPEKLRELRASFDEVDAAWSDVDSLKIDHEALVALVMPKDLKEEVIRRQGERLEKKQRATLLVNYPAYMRKVGLMLTQPWATSGEVTRWDFDMTVFALCAVTGRRPIEVISLGNFERIDENRLRFTGQAKKRDGVSDEGYIIYSLFPTDLVMKAFNGLRELDRAQELKLINADGDLRSQETMINNRVADRLNVIAKRVFSGVTEAWRLYDTRAIYARVCLERWFNHDKRWERVNEDAFFSEILGHDDPTAQLNYKSVKLQDFDRAQPKIEQMQSRADALDQFDDQMPGLARGDSAVKLHQWVKDQIRAEPDKVINQSVITREYKAYRPMVKAYLDIVGEALLVPKGMAKGIDLSFLDTKVTAEDLMEMSAEQIMEIGKKPDEQPEQEQETDQVLVDVDAKTEVEEEDSREEYSGPPMPKFKFRGVDGGYLVTLTFGDTQHQYQVEGSNIMEAGGAAWASWLNSWRDVAIKATKANGWTTLAAELPNGQRIEVTGRGKVEQLRAELIHDVEKAMEHYTNIEE
ncbi:protelomerase family protein [Aeromonas veronii]